jgi:hypothetical protein
VPEREPTIKALVALITQRAPSSVFHIIDESHAPPESDADLYYFVLILQVLLTDMSSVLVGDVSSTDDAIIQRDQRARRDAHALIEAVQDIDGRMRELGLSDHTERHDR